MSRHVLASPFLSYVNEKRKQEDDFDEKILKAVKKEMSADNEFVTNASPIVATTITLEAIQDALHYQGYEIDHILDPVNTPFKMTPQPHSSENPASGIEFPSGPFEDTQFDQVVDVHSDNLVTEEDELNLLSISDIGTTTNSDSSFFDIDPLNYDSGIEEEYYDNKASNSPSVKSQRKETTPKEMKNKISFWDANETEEDTVSRFHCQYLWEFLQNLLSCERFHKYIEWKNQPKGVFKLADHHSVARLWGVQKKRKNMTYDKLSRALRYYYSKNILQKVDGERLTYRFCKSVYDYKK